MSTIDTRWIVPPLELRLLTSAVTSVSHASDYLGTAYRREVVCPQSMSTAQGKFVLPVLTPDIE